MSFVRALLAGLLATTGWSVQGQAAPQPPVPAAPASVVSVPQNQRPLCIAFSEKSLSATDEKRAVLVMSTLARYIAGEIGYKPEVKMFQSDDVLISSVRQGMADLFMISSSSIEFLSVIADASIDALRRSTKNALSTTCAAASSSPAVD